MACCAQEGKTPMAAAKKGGHKDVMQLLKAHGAEEVGGPCKDLFSSCTLDYYLDVHTSFGYTLERYA